MSSTIIDDYEMLIGLGIYPSRKEWFSKYGKHGIDVEGLLAYKKTTLTQIPLNTKEGSLYFHASYVTSIMKEYYEIQDLGITSQRRFKESFEEILVFSEVEGTLEIEGVKTSRKKIEHILSKSGELTRDEQIVFNMAQGIEFIKTHDITEANLQSLYTIVTAKALAKEDQPEQGTYRQHDVDILGKYGQVSDRGVDAGLLEPWMREFIAFIQDRMTARNPLTYLMPHLIHYYMVLLHPYYDYNGRMGRLLSYWYILKCPFIEDKMPVFSEAINYNAKTKALYYRSIENTREDDNDLTYFFETMYRLAGQFVEVYLTLDHLNDRIRKAGMALTQNELNLMKSILLHMKEKDHFTWEDVSSVDKEQYSKQYYLRLLNELAEKEVLIKSIDVKVAHYRLKESKTLV